jgi:antitoxin component YwqK of YwqJK toxin-antitoxin module
MNFLKLIFSVILFFLSFNSFSQSDSILSDIYKEITPEHTKEYKYWDLSKKQVWYETYFLNGKQDGPQISYYKNGKISDIAIFKKGEVHGKIYFFFKNGKIRIDGDARNGESAGTWLIYSRFFGKIKEYDFDNKGNKLIIRRYLWGAKLFERTVKG